MRLGLTVVFVMLLVIAFMGVLGYVMDKQVDRDEPKDDRLTSSAESEIDIRLNAHK
jgi:hypothetical protein